MSDNLIIGDSRPKRADAQENHALLLETAQRLFTEHGVENVSMSAVAEAAGVGKGTLYRHFPNKLALCQALLDADQRDLQARTFMRLSGGDNPAEQLRWFLRETLAFVSRNLPMLKLEDGSAGCSMLDHPAHLWWRLTIRGLLARANPKLDADYAADVLYVMLDPPTVFFQRNVLGYSVERVTAGLLTLADTFLSR